MVKLLNIEKFFLKTSCCDGQSTSCRISAPKNSPLDFFLFYFNRNIELHAVTITIGNKYYGGMSNDDQYKHLCKAIKQTYKFHGVEKYLFYFEQQQNGNLHAHGVLMNAYRGKFIDNFNKFGQRNIHKDSYQEMRNLGYFEYIQKDKIKYKYKPIHNIHKKDYNNIQLPSEVAELYPPRARA